MKDNVLPHHVVGKIAEADSYVALHAGFDRAFAFLKRPDLATLPAGDYVLDPSPDAEGRPAVRAMIQVSPLKSVLGDVQHAEAHGAFIDIQSPLSGPETYGLAAFDPKSPGYAFDTARDVGFLDVPCRLVTLKPGEFAIFFPPCDGHAPCLSADGAAKVRKVVIKIRA